MSTLTSCSFKNPSNTKGSESKGEELAINTKEDVKNLNPEKIINTLCSKEFEGRLVGTKGNLKAARYIERIFSALELDTLVDGSYYHNYYERFSNISDKDKRNKLKSFPNVIGVIRGLDKHKGVVISAHFDHIGYENGEMISGALDNGSGVATLIQMAKYLKEKSKTKPFDMDIIFCAFNSEETGFRGSRGFVQDICGMYYNLYNINIDCVGGKNAGNLALKNISKVSDKLYDAIRISLRKNKIPFSNTRVICGMSDYKSFEDSLIPNINIWQENIKKFIHKKEDTPDKIDFKEIDKISKALCDFIEDNNGKTF